jgi:hypothetical protein
MIVRTPPLGPEGEALGRPVEPAQRVGRLSGKAEESLDADPEKAGRREETI